MYKRDTKVICKGQQWYYIGQDSVGDHLLSKGKGYTGANKCTDTWFDKYAWTYTPRADEITSLEPIASPLENAIEEYKREHGVVGTRPFKVLQEAPHRHPSTWYRFNGSTLEYEHTNGWNKALASNLCDILFNTYEFLYLKGEEPRVE